MSKLAYKPVGMVAGVAASALAGMIFRRAWHGMAQDDHAPRPTDEDRQWSEVLAAAALQGVIFAVVKAAFDRAGATGFRKVTGHWPV